MQTEATPLDQGRAKGLRSSVFSASFDDVRLSSVSESLSGGTTLFSSTRTYDNIGNVVTVATTLSAGTDTQAFCYDEQNRLVWAGSSGTPPCTGTPISAGSLTSAAYSASYSYDAMNRLTSAPTLGNYSYGTAPLHAATSTASGSTVDYSASYDAAGDMVCRAPSSATTCTGTVTGQQLTYDGERRVTHWQSSPSNPTSSADYLYDGSGQRIEQVDTSSGASSRVYYLFGGLEELDTSGSTSTLTKYYSAGGLLIGESVGGIISYLTSDGLGSVSEALSTSGSVTAAQLYGPYGGVRYSSGTMPTAKGFTGQRADALTGLDYYGARYYDPALGQFISADTKQGPNRFAYVAGNPETLTDPTGHFVNCMGCGTTDSCSSDCARPLPGVHVVSDTTSGPVTNSTTNSDFTTTTTTTTYETLTYSNGATKTFEHTSSKTTCDTTCHDKQLLKDELEHKRAANHFGTAVGLFLADLATLGIDIALVASGEEGAWVNIASDSVAALAQLSDAIKDFAVMRGSSADSLQGLNDVVGFLNGLSTAINAAVAVGWLGFLFGGLGDVLSGTFKQGIKYVTGIVGSLVQAYAGWDGMTDSVVDNQETELDQATPQQIQQQCQAAGIQNC